MEIGQKVTWNIGTFTCYGIFIEHIDDELSLVQCYARKEQFGSVKKHITKVNVLTNTLNLIKE